MRRDIRVRLNQVRQFMASHVDKARNAIYARAKGIRSRAVEDLLKAFSGVPTKVSSLNLLIVFVTFPLVLECVC